MLGIPHSRALLTIDAYLECVVREERDHVPRRLLAAADDRHLGTFDYHVRGANDDMPVVQQDLEVLRDADEINLLGTVQNVTAQRKSENQLRRMAYFDALTGMASRSHLMQHIDDRIRIAQRRNEGFTILFINLDGFKDVIDSFGHDIGDIMLVGMYRYAFYRPEMTAEAERRLSNEQLLQDAFEQQQFELYYQPQTDMHTGKLCAVEALIRWHHPER